LTGRAAPFRRGGSQTALRVALEQRASGSHKSAQVALEKRVMHGAGKRRRNTGEKEVPEVPVGLFLSALPRHPVFPSLAEHSRHGVA
jgi:hypothetical protein